jgi:hypothetical protein
MKMPTTFTITATLPYALRNAGCAVDEMDMRRKAATYIETMEDEIGKLERDVREQASGEQDGYLLAVADRLRMIVKA